MLCGIGKQAKAPVQRTSEGLGSMQAPQGPQSPTGLSPAGPCGQLYSDVLPSMAAEQRQRHWQGSPLDETQPVKTGRSRGRSVKEKDLPVHAEVCGHSVDVRGALQPVNTVLIAGLGMDLR